MIYFKRINNSLTWYEENFSVFSHLPSRPSLSRSELVIVLLRLKLYPTRGEFRDFTAGTFVPFLIAGIPIPGKRQVMTSY